MPRQIRDLDIDGVGERLTWIRGRANLSRSKLCKLSDITEGTVDRIELGTSRPSALSLFKICRALGACPYWLAFGEGRPPSCKTMMYAVATAWFEYTKTDEYKRRNDHD